MAIGTTAAILGGAAIAGGSSLIAGSKAASASKDATRTATNESARQFDLVRQDTALQREVGNDALERLRTMFVGGNGANIGNDPTYQFNLAEGQKALDNSLAARGKALSGQGVKEGIRYASGMAGNQTDQVFRRLATIAGIGTQGVNTSAAAGANNAGLVANVNMQNASQRGSAYTMGAAGVNNAAQGGIQNLLLNQYLGGGGGNVAGGGLYGLNYSAPTAGLV